MALATMIEELARKRAEYDAQLKELGDSGAGAVTEFLAPNIPPGWALGWSQYTPYFNDGDACTFSVNEPYLYRYDAEAEEDDLPRYFEEAGEDSMSLGSAARYGEPDRLVEWTAGDGSRHSYTERGYPLVEGLSVEGFRALAEAWRKLPSDLMEAAFGDHVRISVRGDGTHRTSDHDHD